MSVNDDCFLLDDLTLMDFILLRLDKLNVLFRLVHSLRGRLKPLRVRVQLRIQVLIV